MAGVCGPQRVPLSASATAGVLPITGNARVRSVNSGPAAASGSVWTGEGSYSFSIGAILMRSFLRPAESNAISAMRLAP